MRFTRLVSFGLLALALALPQGVALAAAPVKIRVGWLLVPAEITPILFPVPGIARHLGKSYTLETLRFQGSPLLISALAANEIDVAPFGYSSFALAVENAGMRDLRIFADEDRDGFAGHFTTQYMVLKNSGITKVEDLKGKVVTTNAEGSIGDMAMRLMLRKHGIDDRKDVTTVTAAMPNMTAMLLEKKTDLIFSVLPFYLAPDLQREARTLFTSYDAMGPAEISMLTAKESFLTKNRAAVIDFLEDYLRALRWYNDPKNHAKAMAAIAAFTKLPAERFTKWAFTKQDYYRDPEAKIDVKALQSNVNAQYHLGFLKTPLEVKPYVDMSLAAAAAKRLK